MTLFDIPDQHILKCRDVSQFTVVVRIGRGTAHEPECLRECSECCQTTRLKASPLWAHGASSFGPWRECRGCSDEEAKRARANEKREQESFRAFPRVLRSMLLRSRLAPSIRPVSAALARSHRPHKACLIGAIHCAHPPTSVTLFRTMTMMDRAGPEAAHKLLDFVNASPTPFHAVRAASARLEKAGFQKVRAR